MLQCSIQIQTGNANLIETITIGVGTFWKVARQTEWGLGSPSGVQEWSPSRGYGDKGPPMGDKVPQKLKHIYNCNVGL